MTQNSEKLKRRHLMKDSKKQEQRIAKSIGGRRRPGSGNKPCAKMDVANGRFLISAKQSRKSISITKEHLLELQQTALEEGRNPVVHVEFVDGLTRMPIISGWLFLAENVMQGKDDFTLEFTF